MDAIAERKDGKTPRSGSHPFPAERWSPQSNAQREKKSDSNPDALSVSILEVQKSTPR